jgi:hypothetical protein
VNNLVTRKLIAAQAGNDIHTWSKFASHNKRYYKMFMGFVRESCCNDCLRREMKTKIEKCKKRMFVHLLLLLVGIIGTIVSAAIESGITSDPIDWLEWEWICLFFVWVIIGSIQAIILSATKMHTYKRIDLQSDNITDVFPYDFANAFKAPLYNLRSIKEHYKLSEKNKKVTVDLANENCHNKFPDELLAPFMAQCIVLPVHQLTTKKADFTSDTNIETIREAYEQLKNCLTDENEEARVELLHSRIN